MADEKIVLHTEHNHASFQFDDDRLIEKRETDEGVHSVGILRVIPKKDVLEIRRMEDTHKIQISYHYHPGNCVHMVDMVFENHNDFFEGRLVVANWFGLAEGF